MKTDIAAGQEYRRELLSATHAMYDYQMDQADPETEWLGHGSVFSTFNWGCNLDCNGYGRHVNAAKNGKSWQHYYQPPAKATNAVNF